jgi:hypothetical protein
MRAVVVVIVRVVAQHAAQVGDAPDHAVIQALWKYVNAIPSPHVSSAITRPSHGRWRGETDDGVAMG